MFNPKELSTMDVQLAQMMQQQWRCQVKSARSRRKALFLETNKGPLFLKGYTSKTRAEWVVSLSEQLLSKGFDQTLEYVYTREGRPFVFQNGKYYVAIKPIKGRDAQYNNMYDILQTVYCLGEFHRHAQGIKGGPVFETESAPIIDKWEDRLQRFSRIIDRMKRSRSLGGLEKKIVRFSPLILQEAHQSLDMAKRSPLIEEYNMALQNQCVAHRDLASHNFLIGSKTYLIDYDTSMYDTPLVDLIQMINRALDEQDWSFDIFAKILEQYQLSSSLTESQSALTYLLLRYPDNFMREVIGLYEGRSGFVSKKIDSYLTMIMKNWPERTRFFKGCEYFYYYEYYDDSTHAIG